MESYCKCRRLGQIAIPEDDFGLVLTMRPQTELEENYERLKMQLEQLDNSNIEQSKQEKIPLDEGESFRNRYENLNINSKEKGGDVKEMGDLKEKKMKGMKMKKMDEAF
ncbi:hypothetical protein KY290_037044 [Solanum tuberosum]|uniref:Uncharacterized protein n=1 Tax=Solanum tuberosum TaxID=4113 RepID=A0ABQ7TUD6_SOLTU|nr:hypothetical protein KY290_037044 [Solanum tuberosum]